MRRSGIFLPIASLPSLYGIGDFGPAAYRFLRFLEHAGQRVWAILPLLVTDERGSPYASPSSFALNPLLISPDILLRKGFVSRTDLNRTRARGARVQYPEVSRKKYRLLHMAFRTFGKVHSAAWNRSLEGFQCRERLWLIPWAKFASKSDWRFHAFCQWLAHTQWQDLKKRAHKNGIALFGDLPFYVAQGSADMRDNPTLFDASGAVAGAPPDDFFPKGQWWGNPVYRWRSHVRQHFRWWLRRVERALELYDLVRLDHFRGFESVWVIPKGKDSSDGHWAKASGTALLSALARRFGVKRFVAEDIGLMTPSVYALREKFGLQGTRIVQAGFRKTDLSSRHFPNNYPSSCVAYTGTHDMNTLADWWRTVAKQDERRRVRKILHWKKSTPPVWPLIQFGMKSKSSLFITPMQDLLSLGAAGRMNTPGTKTGNWTWRLSENTNLAPIAKKLRRLTQATHRQ